MKLRGRVFRYVAAAAVIACAITVVIGAVLVRNRLAGQQLVTLERQADVVAVVGGAPGALLAGEHVYRIGAAGPQRLRPRLAQRVLAQIPPARNSHGTLTLAGGSFLYAARATVAGGIVLIHATGLLFGVWRPFLLSLIFAGLAGAALAGASSWLLARRLTRPIGELARATALVADGASDVEVAVTGEDELAELARSFNLMSRGLAASRDEQRRFLESVSHELKTPLTSIRGYAEALADGAVTPDHAGAVIAAESGRLERLVADLLDLARLQRVGFAVETVPVDLSEIAARAVERHLPRALELSLELSLERDGRAPGLGDPGRILQAVSNLIENALRLTPAGGAVTVSTEPGQIAVADTGPGFAPEDLPLAFERFHLYDRYRSERAVGSGLGLTIVRELALQMGGEISVANVETPGGTGARFTLRLAQPPVFVQDAAVDGSR